MEFLKEGNARFVRGLQSMEPRKSVHHVRQLAEEGQYPFAIFVSCSDSRVPIEIVFDRGLGDLFSIRLAGNIVPSSALASIEYAALNLGSPLCVVMGHTECGAIRAAYNAIRNPETNGALTPSLSELIEQISPAVLSVSKKRNGCCNGHSTAAAGSATTALCPPTESLDHDAESTTLYHATLANVRKSVAEITLRSSVLRSLVESSRFAIKGAIYDVHTGRVSFDETPSDSVRAASLTLSAAN